LVDSFIWVLSGLMFVSDAHTDADIQKTIHVMQEYFAE
jgi:glutamate-1-semialdehyde aminotransferase